MKKGAKIWIAVLSVLAVLFCGLWISEKIGRSNEHAQKESFCEEKARETQDKFSASQADGEENYWLGVAEFRAFMESYLEIEDSRKPHDNYQICSIAYGKMILSPEEVQKNMDELIQALGVIADDCTASDAYLKLSEWSNLIKE